ncbi:alpha/beta hydrolase [uncultured Mycolicibacterium sp.]|uniref:alpha/beta hydrolase n=1 Tax=uncultured Mycolicibacterium sp. TaxID=2320817 RepID=UPI00262F4898|nr:alpha/beta hydrolase [uncultured Mycolicibacterium sp.]
MNPTGVGAIRWAPDVLPGYVRHTAELGPDPDGEGALVATVVRRGPADPAATHAVLLVHGYTDYFFNTELADHFAARGFACYAVDLHKCGRSRRAGQTPHFSTDLSRYHADLSAALAVIGADSPRARVLVCAHSAGGLIVALWLDALRRRGGPAPPRIGGLVLNSPWLDLQGRAVLRSPLFTAALWLLARLRPRLVLRRPSAGGYGRTLHRDFGGDFDYDLAWKPLGGFPVRAGWLYAIRRGQLRLQRGLDVGVPTLLLRSDRSVAEVADPQRIQRGDAVLDVTQIARWAGALGNRTTVVPVPDAKHDVFLSLPEPRRMAYRELDRWLDDYLALGGTWPTSTSP